MDAFVGADHWNADPDARADQAIARADGGADRVNDARDATETAPPRLAANGVPIPAPRLALAPGVDPCALLDLESGACDASSTCAPFSCDCGGSPLVFEGCAGASIACVVGLSCPFACALGPDAVKNVTACMYGVHSSTTPACTSDADCARPARCLVFPNTAIGECVNGAPGSPCLADADCQPATGIGAPVPREFPACVVAANGVGNCGHLGLEGEACNTDGQCSAGHCLITPGAFVGLCRAPAEDGPCFTQRDCEPSPLPLECLALSRSGSHVCSDRGAGASCEGVADCTSGFCVDSRCTTGAPAAPCNVDGDCLGFCGAQGNCSDGTVDTECRPDNSGCVHGARCESSVCEADGVPCTVDGDCYTGFFCVEAACRTGTVGAPCKTSSQCHVGACISNSTCSEGALGDPCGIDGDCQAQLFCGDKGVCSDGTLGRGCRPDGSGCAARLQCSGGLCAGEGVACKVDADCYRGLFFCASSVCSSGELGSGCDNAHPCNEGSCGSNSICGPGGPGTPCVADSDCQLPSFCGALDRCSDGSSGSACRLDGSGCTGILPCSALLCP